MSKQKSKILASSIPKLPNYLKCTIKSRFVKGNLAGYLTSLFLLTILPLTAARADLGLPRSVGQLSMGYIVSPGNQDPLLMFSNPVSLSAISNWSAASYYTSLYEIKELGVAAVAGSKCMGNWAIGLGASRFGLKQFNQKTFVLGISVRPTPPFYCGVTIKYYTVDIERYSGSSSFLFDAGWKYVVGPIVQISGAIRNFTRATNGGPNEPLPQSYQAGIQLLFENRISLFSEVFKEVDFVPEIRFGAEIDVSRFFKVRIGMTRTPSRFTGGFSLRALGIKIEYGVSHHGILGYTHAFGMILTG